MLKHFFYFCFFFKSAKSNATKRHKHSTRMLTANIRNKPEHVKKSAEMGTVTYDTTAQEANRQGRIDGRVSWAGPGQHPRENITAQHENALRWGRMTPGCPPSLS